MACNQLIAPAVFLLADVAEANDAEIGIRFVQFTEKFRKPHLKTDADANAKMVDLVYHVILTFYKMLAIPTPKGPFVIRCECSALRRKDKDAVMTGKISAGPRGVPRNAAHGKIYGVFLCQGSNLLQTVFRISKVDAG